MEFFICALHVRTRTVFVAYVFACICAGNNGSQDESGHGQLQLWGVLSLDQQGVGQVTIRGVVIDVYQFCRAWVLLLA